jgi:hypothetical protein
MQSPGLAGHKLGDILPLGDLAARNAKPKSQSDPQLVEKGGCFGRQRLLKQPLASYKSISQVDISSVGEEIIDFS